MRLTQIIEALLFASDAPLAAADLARVDERLDEDTITAVIDELRREYDAADRSFQIYEIAGGYQILTRPEYSVVLEQWETVPQTTRLSLPALEVLSIIAYRQPIGRAEVEEIRGVQSAAVLRTLQDRDLIDTVGRAEGLGRPMLYGTTRHFLEHFGFRSLEDLPRPDELPVVLRERPQPAQPVEQAGEEPARNGDDGATDKGAADEAAARAESDPDRSPEAVPGGGADGEMAEPDAGATEAEPTSEAAAVRNDAEPAAEADSGSDGAPADTPEANGEAPDSDADAEPVATREG